MKFSTLNSLIVAACMATTFHSVEAMEQGKSSLNLALELNCQKNIQNGDDFSGYLQRDCSTPLAVVELMNDWENNAIYLKAGTEALAKGSNGNQLPVIIEKLERITQEIEDAINNLLPTANQQQIDNEEKFARSLNRQNALFFEYVSAYKAGNVPLQEQLLVRIAQTNRQMLQDLIRILRASPELREKLRELLQIRTDEIIEMIEEMVNAANTLPPPGQLADWLPSYTAYRFSLDISREIGRTIGNAALA